MTEAKYDALCEFLRFINMMGIIQTWNIEADGITGLTIKGVEYGVVDPSAWDD